MPDLDAWLEPHVSPACPDTHAQIDILGVHEETLVEPAGALAAHCLNGGLTPRQVRNTPGRLAEFQKVLRGLGVPLEWPEFFRGTPM